MTEHGEAQLSAAIEGVEARSRAEVVVVVRPHARDYSENDFLVASVSALSMLAFGLYSSFEFALHWLLILPALTLAASAALLRGVPLLRGMFISEGRKQAAVREAAGALFFARGVRHTRERTGILVFVSLLEQRVEVLADSGITGEVPEAEWEGAMRPFTGLLDEGGDASTLAAALTRLGELLARHCEVREDDIDELPNTIDMEASS